jgi:hypothetical protein
MFADVCHPCIGDLGRPDAQARPILYPDPDPDLTAAARVAPAAAPVAPAAAPAAPVAPAALDTTLQALASVCGVDVKLPSAEIGMRIALRTQQFQMEVQTEKAVHELNTSYMKEVGELSKTLLQNGHTSVIAAMHQGQQREQALYQAHVDFYKEKEKDFKDRERASMQQQGWGPHSALPYKEGYGPRPMAHEPWQEHRAYNRPRLELPYYDRHDSGHHPSPCFPHRLEGPEFDPGAQKQEPPPPPPPPEPPTYNHWTGTWTSGYSGQQPAGYGQAYEKHLCVPGQPPFWQAPFPQVPLPQYVPTSEGKSPDRRPQTPSHGQAGSSYSHSAYTNLSDCYGNWSSTRTSSDQGP